MSQSRRTSRVAAIRFRNDLPVPLSPRVLVVTNAISNPNKIPHHLTTTSFALDGYRIAETLGVVMGITVRSRSVFGLLAATLETLGGGRIRRFVELCERARAEAFELMLQHAEQQGGNAVVAVR